MYKKIPHTGGMSYHLWNSIPSSFWSWSLPKQRIGWPEENQLQVANIHIEREREKRKQLLSTSSKELGRSYYMTCRATTAQRKY